MRFPRLLAAFLVSTLAACADDAHPGKTCTMATVAEMPVLNDSGSPIVEVAVNGTKVAFLVDTGARLSMIYDNAADRLKLPIQPNAFHRLGGIGGLVVSHIVTVDSLSLGRVAARNVDLDSVPGGPERTIHGLPVVGLFGGDFLASYDVEFDLPDHLVSLFESSHCSDHFRPWPTGDFYRLPFRLENETAIGLEIAVNGHKEPVYLDSGAGRTSIDTDAGRDGGATKQTMAQDRHSNTYGIDQNVVSAHLHKFETMDIGPEHFSPAFIEVADMDVSGLLGADFLRARRIWISYKHGVLYVQRVLFPHGRRQAIDGSTLAASPSEH